MRGVIDRYWKEWVIVGNPPDLNRKDYFNLLTGNALKNEVENLQKKIALIEARRLPNNSAFAHHLSAITVTGAEAVVIECVIDDSIVFDAVDGTIRNGLVETNTFETHLTKTEFGWKISDSFTTDSKSGVQPCGAS